MATRRCFFGIVNFSGVFMKNSQIIFFTTLFACSLAAILLLNNTSRRTVFGQTVFNINAAPKSEIERPRVLVDKTASSAPVVSASALSDNLRYKNSLAWIFGSKTQRGWYLYESLIQQTIKTEAGADTPEFARNVASWQRNAGFAPTGVVDGDTLYEMIKSWQTQRLNSSRYAADSELLDAPIADFYDPTRGADLLKVERETYAAYKTMTAAAAKDLRLQTDAAGELAEGEKFLKIISAFRSRDHQARLRAASPNSGSAGLAVNSPHFTGHALDIYVGGEPVSTKDYNRAIQVQTPAYKWLVKNAARFGFYPYYYEPWHWEYVPGR